MELSEIKTIVTSKCDKCGFCRAFCPLFRYRKMEGVSPRGKVLLCYYLLDNLMKPDERFVNNLSYCATCGKCEILCPSKTDTVDAFEHVRAVLTEQGVGPLPQWKKWGDHISKEYNPYLEKSVDRTSWLPGKVKRDVTSKNAEYVYFVGCTSSYRVNNIAMATIDILRKSGLDFTILNDEWCCGSPLLRTGQWKVMKELAQHNVDRINKVEADKMITTCAGCYRTWKVDYLETYKDLVDVDIDFDIIHTTELLADLMNKGELKPTKEFRKTVTYHDPCHLGRHAGVYEAPREVLRRIPGLELIEMPANRIEAWCCAAGGGFKSGFRKEAVEIAWMRVQEAIETGAEGLVSACPFCWKNFRDAIKAHKPKIELYDVAEIVNYTS